MLKFRYVIIALALLICTATASAQLSIRCGTAHTRIGIHVSAYPELALVPVYYAPELNS